MYLCPQNHQIKIWNISASQKASHAPPQETPPREVTHSLPSATIDSISLFLTFFKWYHIESLCLAYSTPYLGDLCRLLYVAEA